MNSENNRTLLHVDDDPNMLRVVKAKLSKQGFDVVSVQDSNAAMDLMVELDCRVVLLDMDMPGKNGIELMHEIKSHDGAIQVIMLTGVTRMGDILQLMKLGAEACIFKPITDFASLTDSLDAAFVKVDRWWNTLRELSERQHRQTAV